MVILENSSCNTNNYYIGFSGIPNCLHFIKFVDERISYITKDTFGECEIRMVKCGLFKQKMNLKTCKDCHQREPLT